MIVDDFRTGRREFIERMLADPGVTLIEGDVLDQALLEDAIKGCDWVFHLQANADVRRGLEHPRRISSRTRSPRPTCSRRCARGVSSRSRSPRPARCTASRRCSPRPRTPRFPVQTSLYAASKLAGEGLIGAYAAGYGFTGLIFRFVSILGERYTHGHVFDFYCALKRDPTRLRVLGDGRQEKSYLYVQDCVEAILTAVGASTRSGRASSGSTTSAPTRRSWWTTRSRLIAEHMGARRPSSSTPAGAAAGRATAR